MIFPRLRDEEGIQNLDQLTFTFKDWLSKRQSEVMQYTYLDTSEGENVLK
jgi:hypothetical protein